MANMANMKALKAMQAGGGAGGMNIGAMQALSMLVICCDM